VLDRIAKALSRQQRFEELSILLADAESSSGLSEHRQRAWMMLCEAYRVGPRKDHAMTCLRALDASPGASPTLRTEIRTRLELLERKLDSSGPSEPTSPGRQPTP
jgi:hypothetical protein